LILLSQAKGVQLAQLKIVVTETPPKISEFQVSAGEDLGIATWKEENEVIRTWYTGAGEMISFVTYKHVTIISVYFFKREDEGYDWFESVENEIYESLNFPNLNQPNIA